MIRRDARHMQPTEGDPGLLFVYGTLMFPEVLDALLDRVPRSEPAMTEGWRAAALADRAYPGLVPSDGSTTAGRLLLDLRPAEWEILNAFEGDLYDLEHVTLEDGRAATAYVWRDPTTVLAHDWDPDRFAATEVVAEWIGPRSRPTPRG